MYTEEVIFNTEPELEKIEKVIYSGDQKIRFKWTTRNENSCSFAVNVLLAKEQKVAWPLIRALQFDLWDWSGENTLVVINVIILWSGSPLAM